MDEGGLQETNVKLYGGMSGKERKAAMEVLATTPGDSSVVVVATGKFAGEGFDEPRLDTLFLAMPVAWKGIVQQYSGRLHRLYENKSEVQIYDYVDVHVGVLERMYHKRLSGYASIGYAVKNDSRPCLVRQHQSPQLRQFRGKHYEAGKSEYCQ
jgi:superfamily II DNA or RNA helicase